MNTILPSFENITELNEFLKPFPNSDDIFVEHQSWLKSHFLPLISIDLGMLKDEWQGQIVHMINPFEPDDGVIGGWTHDFHNEFTGENWFAFKLTDDNRYEFLGNEDYFIRSPVHGDDIPEDFQEDIDAKIHDYQKSKDLFIKTNKLLNIHTSKLDDKIDQENWLSDLGGALSEQYGNWVSSPKPPKAFLKELDDDKLAISHNGNPFYFIAGVPAYNYGCSGADWIVMLYEPISRVVLFTFDWS